MKLHSTTVLKVSREQQGNTLVLRLSGVVDERVDFEKEIGETAPDTLLHCKEISRLNSAGVKAWVQFFQKRASEGCRFRFVECSPPIVELLNFIVNFSAGGEVESIYVPFACTKKSCKKAMVGLFSVEELKKSRFALPPVSCKKCGSPADFDDLPGEYFRFASRPPQKL